MGEWEGEGEGGEEEEEEEVFMRIEFGDNVRLEKGLKDV